MYCMHCIFEHKKNGQWPVRPYNSFSHHCMSYIANVSLSKMTKTTIQKKNYLSFRPVLLPLIMWFCNHCLPPLKVFQKTFLIPWCREYHDFWSIAMDQWWHWYLFTLMYYHSIYNNFLCFTIMQKFRSKKVSEKSSWWAVSSWVFVPMYFKYIILTRKNCQQK